MRNRNLNTYYQIPVLDGIEVLNANSCTNNFPFHSHETFNISLILKNTFQTNLRNKELYAPAGTIFITNANEVHANPCDKVLGNSFFTFYISSDLLKDLNKKQKVDFFDKIIYNKDIFQELFFLATNLKKANKILEHRLKLALTLLIRKYTQVEEDSYKSSSFFNEFINEFNFENFSLNKAASQFGVNKYKFLRLFKQETGLTPNSFALFKKVEQSKELLKKGFPIFNVAIDCGFYDSSHFYKNFKRFTGVNPVEFQNAFTLM